MEALWRQGPLSPADLIATVRRARSWGEPTVKTLLHRLMKKGAVLSVREDGRLRYLPAVERERWREAEVRALAQRLFDGDAAALAAFASSLANARRG